MAEIQPLVIIIQCNSFIIGKNPPTLTPTQTEKQREKQTKQKQNTPTNKPSKLLFVVLVYNLFFQKLLGVGLHVLLMYSLTPIF